MKSVFTLFLFILNSFGLVTCHTQFNNNQSELSNSWQSATLSEVGIDTTLISQMQIEIASGTYPNNDAIVIIKNEKLVFEKYYNNYDKAKPHDLASVTKSILSLLIGIAIDENIIADVSHKIHKYFPEHDSLFTAEKKEITIEHLLMMQSGLEWDESSYSFADIRNDVVQLFFQKDPIAFILSKPVIAPPGFSFNYNSGCSNLLGYILKISSKMQVEQFCEEKIFAPLGITDYLWEFLPNNITYTSGGLDLLPRDMAKIGYLVLNKGDWKGKQIVSEDWVEESTAKRIDVRDNELFYGYHWWQFDWNISDIKVESICAIGTGGQYIFIFPSHEMVVVVTGGHERGKTNAPQLLAYFILPAVLGDEKQSQVE